MKSLARELKVMISKTVRMIEQSARYVGQLEETQSLRSPMRAIGRPKEVQPLKKAEGNLPQSWSLALHKGQYLAITR